MSVVEVHAKPTCDELANEFYNQHGRDYAFFYGEWWKYSNGYWSVSESEEYGHAVQILIQHKRDGIKPTPQQARNLLDFAKIRLRVASERVDTDSNYINLQNGLYNLNSLQIEPHRRDWYSTYQLPFSYDAKADCPTWHAFLQNAFHDPYDSMNALQNIISLQQAFGYSLTGDTQYRLSFWLVGLSGTGKSTVLNVLQALGGSAHISIDLELLAKNEYQLADCAGKRIVSFTEPSSGAVLNDGVYKRLVSSDMIKARKIFGMPFQFRPSFKVWGAMNEMPRVLDRSDAVFNRIVIYEMNNVVPENKRDPQLYTKLMQELPGIFNWALEGLESVRDKKRVFVPPSSKRARDDYQSSNDPEMLFVQEELEADTTAFIASNELYKRYSEWCRDTGIYPKSRIKVASDWKRLGMIPHKSSVIRYQGYRVKGGGITLP